VRAASRPFNRIRLDDGTARFMNEYPRLALRLGPIALARGDCAIIVGA
jgi:hypothetical protein